MRPLDFSCYAGSSALLSTPSDLVRFEISVNTGKLLQPDTVQLVQTPQRLASGVRLRRNRRSVREQARSGSDAGRCRVCRRATSVREWLDVASDLLATQRHTPPPRHSGKTDRQSNHRPGSGLRDCTIQHLHLAEERPLVPIDQADRQLIPG